MRKMSRAEPTNQPTNQPTIHPSIHPSIHFLLLVVALVCTLAFAAPAFAWTHGQFSTTTDACAGCHVAHAAQMPKLLKLGPTQTHFCFLCHGDGGTSAPYDVEDGYTQAAGSAVYASTAGGFVRQFVDADNDGVIDAGELKDVTSRHNVWGFVYGDESGPPQNTTDIYYWIPGGSNRFTGSGFVCSSCHDPHAGGRTPVYEDPPGCELIRGDVNIANPRLLRKSITVQDAAYTSLYVGFQFESVGTFAYSATVSGVYRVIRYWGGISEWCGACHNKFQTDDPDNKGRQGEAIQYFGMWRHPINAHVTPWVSMDTSIATGTPLAYETGYSYWPAAEVTCLTCHRAHSTTVAKAGWATTWPRDATDPATGKSLGDTTALLRMDNRGICYNCHGAGQYNCRNDTRLSPYCSTCHPWTGDGAHPTQGLPGCTAYCHPIYW